MNTTLMTWEQLIEAEPRLRRLERLAAAGGGARQWCNISSTLTKLVGWNATKPEISTSAAYEAAAVHLAMTWKGGW